MGTDLALADPGTMTPVERKEMYDLLLAVPMLLAAPTLARGAGRLPRGQGSPHSVMEEK